MPSYDDVRSSTVSYESGGGRWDAERFARERDKRMYRGPAPAAVRERSRPPPRPPFEEFDRRRRDNDRFEDRFEQRFVEEDQYGPPSSRRRERFVEEDDYYAARGTGPLVHRREETPPRPPRLIRRQSSLDTFDRQPARRLDRAPPIVGVRRRPSPPPVRRFERDDYEEIDIAEPEYYGDEEFRHFREREMRHPAREEVVEERIIEKAKQYPRKGKTKMPKRLVHTLAIQQLGYPYIEEDKVIIIQKALSKELIDEVVSLSRQIRRRSEAVTYVSTSPSPPRREREFVERVVVASPPRRSEALVVERSPSTHRQRSTSRVRVGRYLEAPEIVETRPRSVSATFHRPVSPIFVERRGESIETRAGPVVLVERPHRTERDIREEIRSLEEEKRMLQIERRPEHVGSVDIINDKIVQRSDGETDEYIEVKKDRKAPDSRLLRAMMATLT